MKLCQPFWDQGNPNDLADDCCDPTTPLPHSSQEKNGRTNLNIVSDAKDDKDLLTRAITNKLKIKIQ
jgi:hypothetical protein